jgi:hypothetical protein
MWAVIGIYTGREDNVFWRRLKGVPNKIEAVGAKALCEMDAEALGTDIIHSVINPINKLTGAIHIYGGDFFAAERSEWDSMTLLEHRSDGERVNVCSRKPTRVRKQASTLAQAEPLQCNLHRCLRLALACVFECVRLVTRD